MQLHSTLCTIMHANKMLIWLLPNHQAFQLLPSCLETDSWQTRITRGQHSREDNDRVHKNHNQTRKERRQQVLHNKCPWTEKQWHHHYHHKDTALAKTWDDQTHAPVEAVRSAKLLVIHRRQM